MKIKHLIPLLGMFVILTDPAGRTIFVVKSAVIAVMPPVKGECDPDAHAKIYTVSSLTMCVAEDVVDVMRKVGEE